MNNVSRVLKSFVDKKMAVGVSALITVDGKEVFRDAYGYADIENNIPFAFDTICHIYSMTKIVTTAAAMILYERGLITLEDPVKEYLPEFKEAKVIVNESGGVFGMRAAHKDIRIRNLLTMTAGYPYIVIGSPKALYYNKFIFDLARRMKEDEAKGEPWTTRRFATEISHIPMTYEPSEDWSYGLCADIMGAVIEVVSGKTFGQFLKDEIFEPLNMVDTGFKVDSSKAKRVAVIYDHSGDDIKPYKADAGLQLADTEKLEAGGSGLYSTLSDYTRFLQMLANGGTLDGVKILSRKTVENMRTNHLNDKQMEGAKREYFPDRDYGFGFLVNVKLNNTTSRIWETPGSFGWGGAAGTIARVDPIEKMTTVYMMQRSAAPTEQFISKLMQSAYSLL